MNVLLVNLPYVGIDFNNPNRSAVEHQVVYPPIGLMYLAGRLIGMDFVDRIECLDFNLFDYSGLSSQEDCIAFISERLYKYCQREKCVVCVSLMFTESYNFFEIFERCVKKVMPGSTLICGGCHASNTPDIILQRNPGVDFVICGEGEDALPLLIKNISKGCGDNIVGVHHRGNIKALPQGGFESAPVAMDIDMNLSAYELFDMEAYTKASKKFTLSKKDADQKYFPIIASRGCPGHCTFCSSHTVHGRTPRWRSLDNIRHEIVLLCNKYGVTEINLSDDSFLPKQKFIELLEMLSGLSIDGLSILVSNLSVNHTDNAVLDAMSKAKVDTLVLAIESGNKEMQKEIRKHCDLDKAVSLVRYAKAIGLNTWCYYLIGFPEETVEQMNETIEFMRHAGSDWVSIIVVTPHPGAEMYKQFVVLGYIDDSPQSWMGLSLRNRTFDTSEISAKEINELAYTANLMYNFVNNRHIDNRRYVEAERIFLRVVDIYDFHVFAWDCLRRVYALTNRHDEAEKITRKIKQLLETNPASKGFVKYMHLLEE